MFFSHKKVLLLPFLLSIFMFSCDTQQGSIETKDFVDPSFVSFVSSYTAGTVSSTSPITVRLTSEVSEEVFNSVKAEEVISISPTVEGEAYWIDKQTLEFRAIDRLKSGTKYTVRFNLGKIRDVSKPLSYFEYILETLAQNYDVQIENIETIDGTELTKQKLTGILTLADAAPDANVEKIMAVVQEGRSLPISWDHTQEGTIHRFTVNEITRSPNPGKLLLKFSGESIGANKSDELEVDIPAIGDFKLMSSTVEQSGEQHVLLRFSDPIKDPQNLDGIIQIGDLRSLNYDISGNVVRVYPSIRQTGTQKVVISAGLRNILDLKLPQQIETEVAFEQLKPEIRLINKGNIIAGSEGIVFPFESVSLKAVQVTVIKVYEENISQFLQVNSLEGNREIRRVGRPIFRRTIRLDEGLTNLTKWNRFTLDLSEFMEADPGAMYQIQLGFKKHHSAYFCADSAEDNLTILEEDDDFDAPQELDESSYWDYSEDYYYYDDYDWYERDNPCSDSYFGDRRTVKRNIIASNLGLIGKMGAGNNLHLIVTDIKTTNPLANVSISVLNFQHQIIGTGTTDSNGVSNIEISGNPFLAIADDGSQKGYLKLDDGSALSMSSFDTKGAIVKEGIKGFLYGERGVWRPGDSLHISFILEDKDDLIPEDHPVVFELTDPLGKIAVRKVSTQSENDFYSFKTKTATNAPTGNWNAKVSVGGADFNKRVKIETVKPNRLKINLDFGRDKITSSNKSLNGDLQVNWLHGAPARNLRAEFEVFLSKGKTIFDGYEDYVFDNIENNYYSESYEVFDGRLDDKGHATINSSLYANNNPPGVVNATFMGKVFEEGGNFSIKSLTLPYYPYNRFTGIKTPKGDKSRGMLLTDTTHTVNIVSLDSEGNSIDSRVTVELYKVDWRWWWDNSSYGANYVSDSYKKLIKSDQVITNNGSGTWTFDVKYPDWGRFYVKACDDISGHCTAKVLYIDWPGWAGRAQRDNPGGASMLSFSTDKTSYEVGETVRVDIPGSGSGRALISLESGRKVIDTYWLETAKGENQFVFETTPEMSPGVYINVTMLQEHSQTINDLPIRMYGVLPIEINDPKTRLSPVISMNDVLAPGKPVKITISEANKRKMTYTVAVVDEGLLDLTNYNTPDPWTTFYAREALGVKTWDIFEHVMGAYGGKLERLLAIGGDGELDSEKDPNEANRFKPVVKFLGPFTLDESEEKTHSFIMPEYVGSVKTMVIAGSQGAYGSTDRVTPVRQPVMILGTLPRVLGPGERFTLPVNVFAMEAGVKTVNVSVKTSPLLKAVSAASKQVNFSEPGDKVVYFEYEVAPLLGVATVSINARGGNYEANQEIEIAVRNPNPPLTVVEEQVLKAGESWSVNYTSPGIKGTNTAYLEVSTIPPVDISRRLNYLLSYPHGCIEQTTSAVFPQLYLSDIMELDESFKTQIDNNVKTAIKMLRQFQLNGGGFSYWPGQMEENEWGTNYAGHFLLEARNKGYDVPASMIRSWKKYQSRMASKWKRNAKYQRSDLMQAYRLYTLALEGSPETSAMNRLRENGGMSEQGAWRLAAAYALSGQKNAATELISNRSMVIKPYNEQGSTFGSNLRDRAMILETLALLKDYAKGAPIVKELSSMLSSSRWLSTQETAYSLIAIAQFTGNNSGSSELNFSYSINGSSKIGTSSLPMVQIPVSIESQSEGEISIENKGAGLIYGRLVVSGSPIRGTEVSVNEGLNLQVVYRDSDGNSIDVNTMEQGTEFIAEVTVRNSGLAQDYENLALTQIFPGGWEIVNTRLIDLDNTKLNDSFTYQDIRDDRMYTYFDLNRNTVKKFQVRLIASYSGTYYLPAVSCTAMYDNTVRAVRQGREVMVTSTGIQP